MQLSDLAARVLRALSFDGPGRRGVDVAAARALAEQYGFALVHAAGPRGSQSGRYERLMGRGSVALRLESDAADGLLACISALRFADAAWPERSAGDEPAHVFARAMDVSAATLRKIVARAAGEAIGRR